MFFNELQLLKREFAQMKVNLSQQILSYEKANQGIIYKSNFNNYNYYIIIKFNCFIVIQKNLYDEIQLLRNEFTLIKANLSLFDKEFLQGIKINKKSIYHQGSTFLFILFATCF